MNDVASPLKNALDVLITDLQPAPAKRQLGGHDRLEVTSRGRVWLVLEGSVDLFIVDEHGRGPLFTVPAGQLIDSLPADPARIVAIPSAGTTVVETTREALLAASKRTATEPLVRQAWNDWLQVMAALSDEVATPLTDLTTLEAVRDAAATRAVAHANQAREKAIVDRVAHRRDADRRADHDLRHGLSGMIDLIGITGAHAEEQATTVTDAAEQLLDELAIEKPMIRSAEEYHSSLAFAADQIAQDNRLQYRPVDLAGDWWRRPSDPMLGSMRADGRPCALLVQHQHYRLHERGKVRTVDAAVAAEIAPTAFSFYAPFPTGRLTPWSLLRFGIRRSGRDIFTVGFTLFLAGVFSLVTPIATGWVMDPIIPDAQRGQLPVIAGLLFLLAVGMTSSFLVQSLASLRLETLADNRVQAAVWIRMLNLKAPFFRAFTAGDLANRADGINAMRKLISQSFTTLASGTMSLVFSLALMIWYDWRLALVIGLLSLAFGVVAFFVGQRVVRYNFQSLEYAGNLQGIVLQLIGSIAKLRVAGAERQGFLRWLDVYRDSVAVSMHQRLLNNRLSVLRSAFGPALTMAVIVLLGLHSGELFSFFALVNDQIPPERMISTAGFISFNVALGQFVSSVMSLTRASLTLVMLKPYYSRVQPILEAEEEPRGHAGRLDKIHGQIEMNDVRFRYGPGMPLVLKGLSLTVPAGKVVAIVGPSGAGKSSLVRLLLGFETPEAGDVYIDGTDIRVLDPQDLRRNFGVVLQNGRLLAGSIYDNVSAGLALDEEQVMAALRMASLDEAVKALPMGLHTNVGDGGVAFSGGQRQRLLIARAVIRQPSVLILDEATSALDNVTQRDVVERLKSLQCTQIVIAQRLSTVMAADVIHVIDDGQVVESGTYEELMAKSGLFSQLAQRQLL